MRRSVLGHSAWLLASLVGTYGVFVAQSVLGHSAWWLASLVGTYGVFVPRSVLGHSAWWLASLKSMLRKASAARVNRRLRRYYLIVRLLPNVFALACRSLGSIYYDTGSPQDGKTPFGWLHPCRLVTDSRRYLIVGAPATMPLHSSIYFFPKQPCLND